LAEAPALEQGPELARDEALLDASLDVGRAQTVQP